MTYRELQTALKNLRNAGYDIQVKLNASLEALKAEYERLTAIQDQSTFQQQIELEVEPETSSKVDLTYPSNLPKNEPYSHQENNQSVVEQGFESILVDYEVKTVDSICNLQDDKGSNKLNEGKQLSKPLEALPYKEKQIEANSTYWIDGTELGQNLNHTQAQALRNLEDGINWLVKLPGRLKAFESGFREGLKKVDRLRQIQPSQPQVVPIHSKRRQPVPMAAWGSPSEPLS